MDPKDECPSDFFWFKAKNDLIDQFLKKISKKGKILSVGVGTGEELEILKKYGDVYAIDISEFAVRTSSTTNKALCDAVSLPFKNKSFETIAMLDVLEHIEDDTSVISECKRILTLGGNLIITVPAFNRLYSAHDVALGHKRRYNKKMLKKLVKLNPLDIGYWCFSIFPILALQRLLNKNKKPKVDTSIAIPIALNKILYKLLSLENYLISKKIKMPIGSTIYATYQKN